jgi:hypothetical protein
MSSELFMPIKFRTSVQLVPKELVSNFEEIILRKIKNNLENVCSRHGFIKNNSIKIIKRSIGQCKKQHFNGNIMFDIQCIAEICNPAQGSIIKCKVKAKNPLGLLAEGYYDNVPILEIIIPKISAGIQSEINIDKVEIGEEINIEVCGKKYQLYDKHISIIGKAIKDKEENIKNIIEEDIDDDRVADDASTILNEEDLFVLNEDDEDDNEEDIDDDVLSTKKIKIKNDDDEDEDDEKIDDENEDELEEFDELEDFDDVDGGGAGDEEYDYE